MRREILDGGGDASVCEARFVDGLSDEAVEALFTSARDRDYAEIAKELRALQPALTGRRKGHALTREQGVAAIARLRRRFADVAAIDFFGARARDEVDGLLAAAESSVRAPAAASRRARATALDPPPGRTWVTRTGVHIDRIASAWLIRRFIDPEARVQVRPRRRATARKRASSASTCSTPSSPTTATSAPSRCCSRDFGLDDPALRPLAEIVHDIDLKEAKFARPETRGVDHLVAGIAWPHASDEARLARRRAPSSTRSTRTSERGSDDVATSPSRAAAADGPSLAPRAGAVLPPPRHDRLRRPDRARRLHAARPRRASAAGSAARTTRRASRSRSSPPDRSPRSSRSTSAGSRSGAVRRHARRPSPSSCRRS